MKAGWLLRLYPTAWRQRYGAEFEGLLSQQRASPGLVIDIVLGAVDAWRSPQLSPAESTQRGGAMLSRLYSRCAATRPDVSRRDHAIALVVVLVVTVGLTLLAKRLEDRYGRTPWTTTIAIMSFPTGMFFSMPINYTKGWPWLTQAVLILGIWVLAAVLVFLLALGGVF